MAFPQQLRTNASTTESNPRSCTNTTDTRPSRRKCTSNIDDLTQHGCGYCLLDVHTVTEWSWRDTSSHNIAIWTECYASGPFSPVVPQQVLQVQEPNQELRGPPSTFNVHRGRPIPNLVSQGSPSITGNADLSNRSSETRRLVVRHLRVPNVVPIRSSSERNDFHKQTPTVQ